jgi:hypothetical protein
LLVSGCIVGGVVVFVVVVVVVARLKVRRPGIGFLQSEILWINHVQRFVPQDFKLDPAANPVTIQPPWWQHGSTASSRTMHKHFISSRPPWPHSLDIIQYIIHDTYAHVREVFVRPYLHQGLATLYLSGRSPRYHIHNGFPGRHNMCAQWK